MRLSEYMREMKLTDDEFASAVGATAFAVGKWRRGERTPRDAFMRKIVAATKNCVTPNDFLSASAQAAEASQ